MPKVRPIRFPKSVADSSNLRINALKDDIDKRLSISESFDAAASTGFEGEHRGLSDRARHIYWQRSLANKHGETAARAAGVLHEVTGFPSGVLKEGLGNTTRETISDFLTNEFALDEAPRDEDGNVLPPDIDAIAEEIKDIPVDEDGVADAVTSTSVLASKIPKTDHDAENEERWSRLEKEMELFNNATPEQQKQLGEIELQMREQK